MSQINNATTCQCKDICNKMQKESLRKGIESLKIQGLSTNAYLKVLKSIINVLEVYSCVPGTCLCDRVRYVCNNIKPDPYDGLTAGEREMINILIAEIKAFLNS